VEIVVILAIIGAWLWWRSRNKGSDAQRPQQPPPPPPPHVPRSGGSRAAQPPPPGAGRNEAAALRQAVEASESCWVPLGHPVSVAGLQLPGGVYVGRSLPGFRYGPDPALINPQLKVDRNRLDTAGQSMGYWPSYSEITPQARAAYLSWLAAGRPGGAYIGYVFLWFYGVERRVLVDATQSTAAANEVPGLISEVERLLELYADNGSFRSYASDFLGAARLVTGLDTDSITPPRQRSGWDLPIDVKLVIGDIIADKKPIPAEWALAWLVCHPETRLRTPATRCVDEFSQLFAIRYQEQFGDGLKVAPNKTRLKLHYRPASASFGGRVELSVGELPDISRLSAPVSKLRTLADQVIDELDAFSRHLGRRGDRTSLEAQALLPPELIDDEGPAATFLTDVTTLLAGHDHEIVETAQLVERWPSATAGKLTKKEAAALATLLAAGGIGIEPDVRFGGANLSKTHTAVLFRLPPGGDHDITGRFAAATSLLHVAAAVATANETVTEEEERHLEEHLETSLHLDEPERVRLRAHLKWLLAARPSLAGMKKRLEVLTTHQRAQIGRFLIGVAGADGHVHPEQLKMLTKLYPMLGLDPDDLYADVHALSVSAPPGDAPVQVLDADPAATHAIPAPPPEPSDTLTLAPEKVEAIMAETESVAATLGAVFDETDDSDEGEIDDAADEDDESATIAGLDETHSTLLVRLAERPVWPRSEFDELIQRFGLLPAGAMETINEAVFAACDEPMLEGTDPIEVNDYAVEELLA
jgi:uncharacterized tellurite resistance protein B-like protein